MPIGRLCSVMAALRHSSARRGMGWAGEQLPVGGGLEKGWECRGGYGGKWWKMVENGGKWWKMVENGGKWWKMVENGGK